MRGHILIVDDSAPNRELLQRRLERQGHQTTSAENGEQALALLKKHAFDLVLLDILMPGKDGFQVLQEIKADPGHRHLPIIMLSALDDIDQVARCLAMGAEDYLHKPFNPIILRARIDACLEKKRLRDMEQEMLERLRREQETSERLLLNILPKLIADRLRANPTTIADHFPEVSVLFADIVGFTKLSGRISPRDLVDLLNLIFSRFDRLTAKHSLEKIKTVGDMYMVVGGLPTHRPDHAEAVAALALDILGEINLLNKEIHEPFQMRIGINTGPVVAGVIGTHKFSYDLWGDTVNTASRMESHAPEGAIQVSAFTYERLKGKYRFEERGSISVKGKGEMKTYLLRGRI
ncbi:MAG: adenylate/guanylate cyclase domain-containing protein [Verrucomicrobiae bacterium]|nr:adenylate/guanylate cyclase domain-containing protein [Verrucomicrobiae bacterium]